MAQALKARSPEAQSRDRLSRQMSQDLDDYNRSVVSSTGSNHGSVPDSTLSGFDPENEAIMSTRQLDTTTQRLPELRASAKKYERYSQPEPDFLIDTSAIGRAFPDFTQGCSSPDDSSISVEIGRGMRKGSKGAPSRFSRSAEFSSKGSVDAGNDTFAKEKVMIGDYQVMYTPPKKSRLASKKDDSTNQGSVRKDSQAKAVSQKEKQKPSQPFAKTADYGSGSSRQGGGGSRRTLAEMHARVTNEDDASYISEERPPTVTLTATTTRFGNAKNRQSSAAPTSVPSRFTSTASFLQELKEGVHKGQEENKPLANHTTTTDSMTGNATQQSFMLPDLPNITELVSGIYHDGTPVFSKNSKSRSRFTSVNPSQAAKKPEHLPMESIPVPEDEKAIFVSLKLLQDKVAELESNRSIAENRISELDRENNALKAEKREQERFRRSDSALGMTDGVSDDGGEMIKGKGNWLVEKAKLDSTNKSLKHQLDISATKVAVAEITIQNYANERDAAVTQLGMAYCASEELKTENEQLKRENEQLKRDNDRFRAEQRTILERVEAWCQDRERQTQEWTLREAALKNKIIRRDEAMQEIQDMTNQLWGMRPRQPDKTSKSTDRVGNVTGKSPQKEGQKSSGPINDKDTQTRIAELVQDEIKRIKSGTRDGSGSTQTQDRATSTSSVILKPQQRLLPRVRPKLRQQSACGRVNDVPEAPAQNQVKRVVVEEVPDSDESEEESRIQLNPESGNFESDNRTNRFVSTDETVHTDYSSFLDGGEIAQMRAILDQRRTEHMERLIADANNAPKDDTVRSAKSNTTNQAVPLPRKSSMKNVTPAVQNMEQYVDNDLTGRFSVRAGEDTGRFSEHKSVDGETGQSGMSTDHQRRHSEPSTRSRRGHATEEMTSAFIVPDITLRGPPAVDVAKPAQSNSANPALDQLAQHDGQNCTICTKAEPCDEDHTKPKMIVKVPAPVPVSERMPEAGPYEEEPTMRPSQPPAQALAVVMKALEDELAHLKMDLAKYQAVYNQHDPSLSKRKRKYVYSKIETLLKAIDVKADQIYALYDVLEGQKADGHAMDEKDVEHTLNSIGVELGNLGRQAAEASFNKAKSHQSTEAVSVGSDDSEDDELPWEGVETTAETSKSSKARGKRKSISSS